MSASKAGPLSLSPRLWEVRTPGLLQNQVPVSQEEAVLMSTGPVTVLNGMSQDNFKSSFHVSMYRPQDASGEDAQATEVWACGRL